MAMAEVMGWQINQALHCRGYPLQGAQPTRPDATPRPNQQGDAANPLLSKDGTSAAYTAPAVATQLVLSILVGSTGCGLRSGLRCARRSTILRCLCESFRQLNLLVIACGSWW